MQCLKSYIYTILVVEILKPYLTSLREFWVIYICKKVCSSKISVLIVLDLVWFDSWFWASCEYEYSPPYATVWMLRYTGTARTVLVSKNTHTNILTSASFQVSLCNMTLCWPSYMYKFRFWGGKLWNTIFRAKVACMYIWIFNGFVIDWFV